MPADLRIAQLVTNPYKPEAMAPFFFTVECVNVGDEGTGPFVVRFELDQAESVELPVQNVAPQESEWVNWPYDDGLVAGDHYIYCLLDAAHAVPEPEAQHNQQSRKFEVAEIEFAPQDAQGDASYDEEALADAVINKITDRVILWTTLAFQAVNEWKSEAEKRVADYSDADATVDPFPVITAFGEAMIKQLPGMSTPLGIMEDASGLVGLVRSYLGDQHMGLVGARARLIAAIDELQVAANEAIRQAIDGYEDRLQEHLSPQNGNSPLHQIEYGSTRSAYVAALADWLGVPQPKPENTTAPIKQKLMEGFERVMEDVNRQLFREVL